MIRVLLFTSSVLLALGTHSILVMLASIGLCLLSVLVLGKRGWIVIVYLLSIVSGWGSVLVYDSHFSESTTILTPDAVFTVLDQQRENRYLIEDSSSQEEFLLYSNASLAPGDTISSSRRPVVRTFTPERCLGICSLETHNTNPAQTFNYDAWLYMQGIAGSLYDDNPWQHESMEHKNLDTRTRRRTILKDHITQGLGQETIGALGLGMLIGDRSLFTSEDYTSFIESGLVHLVAVSGGNIAIMVALASLLLFRVPFTLRTVLLVLVVIAYAYLVGSDSSVIRATIMALLTLAALLPGRQISIWRLLAYAWVLMLLWNPYYLFYDLGFLLSFGALLGIIWSEKYVFQRIHRAAYPQEDTSFTSFALRPKLWTRRWWKDQLFLVLRILILPSIGAMVGVLPVLVRSTGQINLLSPVLNILLLPWVPLLTGGLVITSLLGGVVVLPGLERGLGMIVQAAHWGATYGLLLSLERRSAGLLGILLIAYWSRWIWQETQAPTLQN